MSGRAAKLLRRDMRRAIGEEAVEAVTAATSALNNVVAPNLNALNRRVEGQSLQLRDIDASQMQLSARVETLEGRANSVTERFVADDEQRRINDIIRRDLDHSFLQRLHWFLFGR